MRKLILVVFAVALLLPATTMAANVGYDGGFYVANDEDTFKLKFSGRVQTSLFYDKTKGDSATLQFKVRRAVLGIGATVHEKLHLGFSLKHTAVDRDLPDANLTFQTMNVTGATASLEIIPPFVVTVGMVGLPLAMISEISSKWFLVIEAPMVTTRDDTLRGIAPLRSSFGTPDGIGINFSGSYWKWFYSFSVVNAAESNYAFNNNSKRMSFGFRTGFNILDPVPGSLTDFECSQTPKLTISLGSMYQNKRQDDTLAVPATIKYMWSSSLGVGFRWAGFAITTEGFYRRTKISDLGSALWARPKLTDIGYYAAVGYYIIPKKFEIAGQAGQTIRQGPANNSWEFGGGLNYYILENNLKLQLAYRLSRFFDLDAAQTYTLEKSNHNITLMASAFF